jgi:hypothetical protein
MAYQNVTYGINTMPLYLRRATLLVLLTLGLVLQAMGQSGSFEVSCPSLPSGWKAGESGKFSASRQGESPHLWGQIHVSGSSPMTLEKAKDNIPPHPDDAAISWETTKFRERTAFIYHQRTDYRPPNNQGSTIEFDRYFIQLEGETWAMIDLNRSCNHSRVVMQDGSEPPPNTVPMPYEIKFIPVNADAVVAQIKAEEEQILNSLKFTVSGEDKSTNPGDSEEIPWGVVAGVAGAAAVISAAVAAAIKAAANKNKSKNKPTTPPDKAKTKEKKREPKQPVVYVLQLSSDNLKVAENAPADLTVQVWKVDPKTKACQPAADAVIETSPPAGIPTLQQSKRASPGRLDCRLTLSGPVQINQAVLQVRAQAGGSNHGADVRLNFDSPITMEFF